MLEIVLLLVFRFEGVLSDRTFGRKIGSTLNEWFILNLKVFLKSSHGYIYQEGKTVAIAKSKIVGNVAKCAAW